MSLKTLEELTNQIGEAISQDIDSTNAAEVSGKLNELSALQSNASHCMALAESTRDQKIMDLAIELQYSKLSATDKKYIILGKAKDESYYYTLSERLTRSLSHRLDALRSILSFIKAEMEHLNSQTH
jgi:vacuolar-type H+-ATPase subunit B/Vma2